MATSACGWDCGSFQWRFSGGTSGIRAPSPAAAVLRSGCGPPETSGRPSGATLLFNFLHYAVRPWPRIVVAPLSLVEFPPEDPSAQASARERH
jgi:hypothetical protein